jgi:hypothetical protein
MGNGLELSTAINGTMNYAETSFNTEIFAGAIISVVQHLAPLRKWTLTSGACGCNHYTLVCLAQWGGCMGCTRDSCGCKVSHPNKTELLMQYLGGNTRDRSGCKVSHPKKNGIIGAISRWQNTFHKCHTRLRFIRICVSNSSSLLH